jgi:uncharacterized protein YceH (UPF0502 family)
MFKRIGILLAMAFLAVFVVLNWQSRAAAQSTVNLQADLYRLQSQVSQLQAQVAQLSGRAGYSTAPSPAPGRRSRINPTDGEIIDRLATLAIEAKDRLSALEARVARLEQRLR